MNIVETIANINELSTFYQLPVLTKLQGLRCSVYYPLENESHYNNDTKFSYSENPNQTKQILIKNTFQEVLMGNNSYDPYGESLIEAIVLYQDIIPVNSKIQAFKGSGYTLYRVDNNPNVITSNDGKYLFVKHKLIAIS